MADHRHGARSHALTIRKKRLLILTPAVPGRIVFLDTEFITLIKKHRMPWEIGGIIRDPGCDDVRFEWQIRPPLGEAEPDALRIGRYYQRCRLIDEEPGTALLVVRPPADELAADDKIPPYRLTTTKAVVTDLAAALSGAYVVAAIPAADETALGNLFDTYGQVLANHYRTRDIESVVLGYLNGRRAERLSLPIGAGFGGGFDTSPICVPPPPWSPTEMSKMIGVDPPSEGLAHRALVDADWVMRMWDKVHA